MAPEDPTGAIKIMFVFVVTLSNYCRIFNIWAYNSF